MSTDVSAVFSAAQSADLSRRRLAIGFLNWAHALDHFVMLVYPTVVIELQVAYGRSYAQLIALSTASFIAFGLFSLPAGWLADRWSRRNMMVAFYLGCGLALTAAAVAPSLIILAVALFALGVFAAIYHPVGTAMVIENATQRGRTLAFNGVCGNLGVSLAAGTTALLTAAFSWRGAFLLPGLICIVTGAIYLWLVPDETRHKAARSASPDVALSKTTAAIIFGLFVVVALSAGLVFNTLSVALPKIVDERVSGHISLVEIGGLTTAVFICGALAQIAIGRLVEIFRLHVLFATLAVMQFTGVVWTAYASGVMVLFALAFTMAAIYAQITVNDLIIARYTADAWRGRVYAVRYFLTFMVSGVAVSMIALLYGRGGFTLVLGTTAVIALGFLIAVLAIAYIASGVERARVPQPAPAE
ncbi:MAG: MFS transporter [Hyphomicrobiales bacterium]|nr:MFS transporter [Hyphomicrobiales bacterium]MDE2374706.1 MFS transporter [Hyphomicrobiales bacterium]